MPSWHHNRPWAWLAYALGLLPFAILKTMGKHKWGTCVYCGKEGVVTRDHVIPKALFTKPMSELITVPACGECNSSFKLDEEYFRACVVIGLHSYDHPEGRALWQSRVRESFKARPGFRALLASQARLGTVQSESGWVMNNVPMLEIDRARIERVVKKMVQGPYWHHRTQLLPSETPFLIWPDTNDPNDALKVNAAIWKALSPFKVGPGTLTYRFGISDERPEMSAWFLLFFNGVLFSVITGDVEEAERLALEATLT